MAKIRPASDAIPEGRETQHKAPKGCKTVYVRDGFSVLETGGFPVSLPIAPWEEKS